MVFIVVDGSDVYLSLESTFTNLLNLKCDYNSQRKILRVLWILPKATCYLRYYSRCNKIITKQDICVIYENNKQNYNSIINIHQKEILLGEFKSWKKSRSSAFHHNHTFIDTG